jgi:ribosomal protein S18 acetylase RimI-like enzyme
MDMAVITLDRTVDIVKAATDDAPQIARTLARSFEDDPAARWFFPDDSDRLSRLERMFGELALPNTLPHEETYTTGELAGAALWIPPGEADTGIVEQLRMLPKTVSIWGLGALRAVRGFAFMESRHPGEPHYYLWILGVHPGRQGRGIGTALMRPVLERCDEEGVPAYLEATSSRNRDLYLRNGFEVVEEVRWPGDGPPLWLMWRKPGARTALPG